MTVSITPVLLNLVHPADIMPNSRPNVSALPLLMAAEPVTPAKTTPVRQDIANPPATAPIIRPERPRLKPGQSVMPVPRTATPAPQEHKLQPAD